MAGHLLKGRARHFDEGFSFRSLEHTRFRQGRDVALDEDLVGVRQNKRRARTVSAELRHRSVLSDDFCNLHVSRVIGGFRMNQNYAFWFTTGRRTARV